MINEQLLQQLLAFRENRDWEKFHNPKDMAISLVLESSELLEIFQWKTDKEVSDLVKSPASAHLSEEIADIAIYLSYLCHDLGIDLNAAVAAKLEKNEQKYPTDKVRGSAKKYNAY